MVLPVLWKEVIYAARAKVAGISRDQLSDLCSGSVSPGRHYCLACWLDFLAPGLWGLLHRHCSIVQVQPWPVTRTYEFLLSKSKNLGQGVHSVLLPALPGLDGADPTRCSAISLVTYAPCPPDHRSNSAGEFVPSDGSDFSRKLVSVISGPYSTRQGTNSHLHWTLSLCTSSAVCWRDPFFSRNASAARLLVRLAVCPGHDRRDGHASSHGGTYVARRIARLRRLHGTGQISPRSLCLVKALHEEQKTTAISWLSSS